LRLAFDVANCCGAALRLNRAHGCQQFITALNTSGAGKVRK
jgi:hypothetical protein